MKPEDIIPEVPQGLNEARRADNKLLALLKKSLGFSFYAMSILVVVLFWTSRERPTTITGHIAGLPDGELFISGTFLDDFGEGSRRRAGGLDGVNRLGSMGFDLNEIVEIRGGRFKLILPDDGTYLMYLFFRELFEDDKHFIPHNSGLWFVVEQGNRIKITGRVNSISEGLSNVTISDSRLGRSASRLNRDFASLQNQLFEIHKHESREEFALFQAMVEDGNIENMNLGLAQREERNNANLELLDNFIRTNPDNPLSAFIVAHMLPQINIGRGLNDRLPPDSIVPYYHILEETARNSIFSNLLNAQIESFKRSIIIREAIRSVVVGSQAPDFTLSDVYGNPFTLSSLRGRYVVLIFWGTWCPPCMRGKPRLKEIYETYKDVVEFVGVASRERSVDTWRETVQRLELPWANVFDESSMVSAEYGVVTFPTKYIISPDGTILVRGLGFGSGALLRELENIIER
ncbi:MAG: TlpA family protein disulfide reductase [Bacteroidales bacterium]|nr:TlpA family protein disulfide reductase [Bacteroidales bacterium]